MRVRPRAPALASGSRHDSEKRRNEVARDVIFGITSAYCRPHDGLTYVHLGRSFLGRPFLTIDTQERGRGAHLATTMRDWLGTKGQPVVHLSYEELPPLMSNDITEEERLMQQLIVAK
jgi:hypothetical protein